MLTHAQVWAGIDRLADRASLSASGLAKRAGLDPTTFNKSKRHAARGDKERWPSTESIAKALEATGATFEEFAALASGAEPVARPLPTLSFSDAGAPGRFDEAGRPSGSGWSYLDCPWSLDPGSYALELNEAGYEPIFRSGDRIIVSPVRELEPGHRVLLKEVGGGVRIGELIDLTDARIKLLGVPLNGKAALWDLSRFAWISRILWASQ